MTLLDFLKTNINGIYENGFFKPEDKLSVVIFYEHFLGLHYFKSVSEYISTLSLRFTAGKINEIASDEIFNNPNLKKEAKNLFEDGYLVEHMNGFGISNKGIDKCKELFQKYELNRFI
ncbi:hypothetical protein HOK68_01070 [Candidatus Woesearchaeota archaeon]|jgi:hypothetical protein|nr:hypothetical protein [Candidatus Woesearchaeota archaeon]MBT4387679.1 hypothetical protein [Candidatus Woesearchaeota archaeon]MBT4595958.1 hypothetical protein [Candidatus Woesearchaeota archaeon]MBT5741088.1 hypothetical protein [Candidatus Woesearchaeota archaeon]MBT6505352.1 hypothetical protein [Candidatus Woesearchaeota archaeon]